MSVGDEEIHRAPSELEAFANLGNRQQQPRSLDHLVDHGGLLERCCYTNQCGQPGVHTVEFNNLHWTLLTCADVDGRSRSRSNRFSSSAMLASPCGSLTCNGLRLFVSTALRRSGA